MFSKNYFEKQVNIVQSVIKNKRYVFFSSLKILKNAIQKLTSTSKYKNINIKKPKKFFVINIDARLKKYLEENFQVQKR
jgi:hypothetical protein